MEEFNNKIENYLENMLKNTKGNINEKNIQSEVTCYLGVAYEYGLFNKPKNYNVAFYYYTISAQLNSDLGTFRLAICYEKGIGTPINNEKAVYFYRCVAKLGLVDGMHVYGTILVNGFLSSEKNFDLGKHFLALSAFKSDSIYPYSLFDMGKYYENKTGEEYVMTDNDYAINMYLKGSKFGDPNCMYRLGKAYETGDIVKNCDMNKAYEYYKKGANKGQISAQIYLSKIYFNGNGTKKIPEFKKSYMWALCAATKCSSQSAYIIGEYALSGCGVEKNKLLALWWFIISNNLGNENANLKITELKYQVERENEGIFKEPACCNFFC